MTEVARKLATSDGTIILNRLVSIDGGTESGFGSDSDSNNGTDPALTPSPSSHPSLSEDQPPPPVILDRSMSTSGRMNSDELLSADAPDLQHLAERYAGDVPHDVMNVRLEEKFARLVVPPPPPIAVDSKPEIDPKPEVDIVPAEKRSGRRLPPVPSNKPRSDERQDPVPRFHDRETTDTEAAKKDDDRKQQEEQEKSAELWCIAASVGPSGYPAKSANQSAPTSAGAKHKVHGHTPRQDDDDSDEFITVSTLPRSRDRHQPISDVAPASRPLHSGGDQMQRVEVVKAPHTGAQRSANGDGRREVTSSQRDVTDRHDRALLETFRPIKPIKPNYIHIRHINDVTDPRQQQAAVTSRVSKQSAGTVKHVVY